MVTGGVVVILLNNVYYPTVGSHSLQEVGSRDRIVGAHFKSETSFITVKWLLEITSLITRLKRNLSTLYRVEFEVEVAGSPSGKQVGMGRVVYQLDYYY